MSPLVLRLYQQTAVDTVFDCIARGNRRIVLKIPTRGGKTLIATEIAKYHLEDGRRVAFVTPRLSLIEQTCRAFERQGLTDLGVVQGGHYRTNSGAPLQICSAQTLARREIPKADLVIVDECHLRFKSTLKWMSDPEWQDVPFLGLSATPWAKGMGKYWAVLLRPVDIPELQDQGVLAPFRVLAPPPPDLTGVGVRQGDFVTEELSARCDRPEIVGDVIKTCLKHASDRPTLVYAIDCSHAKHLQERFIEAEVAAEYCVGNTPMFEREDMFRRFERGETKVLCSVGTIDVGVDLPCANCVVDARPTKSRMRYVQSVGRGITAYPGKDHCLVLDHAGNCLRLGMIDEIESDVLDDGEEKRSAERQPDKEPKEAKLCPECHCVQAPRARVCPQCGYQFFAVTLVREREGELVEFGSKVKSEPEEPRTLDKRLWHAGLLRIAIEAEARGKVWKPSWAAMNFKEKFGQFPPWDWKNDLPIEPSVECKNWVRSKQIAFAKSRQRYG